MPGRSRGDLGEMYAGDRGDIGARNHPVVGGWQSAPASRLTTTAVSCRAAGGEVEARGCAGSPCQSEPSRDESIPMRYGVEQSTRSVRT